MHHVDIVKFKGFKGKDCLRLVVNWLNFDKKNPTLLTMTVIVLSTVYNAVGLAAYELFDNVDFDQWFKNQLLGELQVSHHRYCVDMLNCQ